MAKMKHCFEIWTYIVFYQICWWDHRYNV